MKLIAELNNVLLSWDEIPTGTVLVAMPRTKAMPLLRALMDKMRVFGAEDWKQIATHPNDPPMTVDAQFERYFQDLTQNWTSDYAFIGRYENETRTIRELLEDDTAEPRVMALIDRWSSRHARWLYLTGGLGQAGDPLCGGEVVDQVGRPRGLIRRLLFEIGIREIEIYCGDQTPMKRGATQAGYDLKSDPESGRLKGVLTLKREEYLKPRHVGPIVMVDDIPVVES